MKEIKWYDVPRGAKCLMNSNKWEQIFECLWVDWMYLRWKNADWEIGIGQLNTYMIDEPYTGTVYEKLI